VKVEPHHERSPVARARAEQALIRLLEGIDAGIDLIVLGGLVPQTLASSLVDDAPEHLGTADVDVLLITHVDASHGLAPVEVALNRMNFEPVDSEGWRWHGPVDGTTIRIEFLCDLEQYREGEVVRPPDCRNLAANNLRGTGYVSRDFQTHALTRSTPEGQAISVEAKFAGFQGYLLSKCVAARTRGAVKDYYDLAYVLLHNRDDGPKGAADLLLAGPLRDAVPALQSTFVEVGERYRQTKDIGPSSYASEMLRMEPDAEEARLRASASVGVTQFIDRLLERKR
jgi:hypothetical protein